jgi:hypothetical protein
MSTSAAGSSAAQMSPVNAVQRPVRTTPERRSWANDPAMWGTRSTGAIGGRTELSDVSALPASAALSLLTDPPVANPALARTIAHDLSVGDLAAAYGLTSPPSADSAAAVEPPTLSAIDNDTPRNGRMARPSAGTPPGPPQAAEPTRLPHGPTGPQGGGLSLGAGGGAASPLAVMVVLMLIAAPCLGLVTRFRIHIQPTEGYRLERPG